MSVYKRGSKGIWYMNFTINGVRCFKSTGCTTKKDAKHAEAMERQRLLTDAKVTPQEKAAHSLLSDAIDQVYQSRWKHNKDGMGSYRRARLLMENIGNVAISSIDHVTVDALVRKLEGTGIESSTVNRYLATLKTILKHFRLQVDFIKLKKEKSGRIRILSKEEELNVVRLLREAKGKMPYYIEAADMVEVLADTGCRLSEILKKFTYKEHINYQNNLMTLTDTKNGKIRSVPMTKRVRTILEERQHINEVKPFTITRDEAERAWQWVRAEMGLEEDGEFVIHALRHTCASRLVNKGVDLYVVCKWLGHSSIQITERYSHLDPRKLVHAVEMLE